MTSKSRCDSIVESIHFSEPWVSCLEVSEVVLQICLLAPPCTMNNSSGTLQSPREKCG